MKPLPKLISQEIQLPVDYVNLRGLTSGKAYRTQTMDGKASLWLKVVYDKELGTQLQIHLRFDGQDFVFGQSETVDLDVYLPAEKIPLDLLTIFNDQDLIDLVHYKPWDPQRGHWPRSHVDRKRIPRKDQK